VQEKVLFVDDEPAVLQGYQRLLRNEFQMDTAVGGKGALIAIETTGPYAVVISDMRMPEMTGVEVLRKVKELSPDSVRMMLSGHADLNAAIAAVNEGSIFRFLTKPCSPKTLIDGPLYVVRQCRKLGSVDLPSGRGAWPFTDRARAGLRQLYKRQRGVRETS